ncbi:hypothetical protein ACFROC_04355 [Nocardia tengchongensis]|uniref:hypothetical protein n=1 Tax=Nocardia tengchongensis TaxID=2055889 RepID=UPI00369A1D91
MLGFGISIVISLGDLDRMVSSVDQFQRLSAPGSRDLKLEAGHDYTGYFEYADARTSVDLPSEVTVSLTDPAGHPVSTKEYHAEVTYLAHGYEGRAVFSFHAAEGGAYRLTTEGGSGVTVAVGSSISQGLWLSSLPGFIGVGLGIGTIVLTFGRRRRFRRRLTRR